MGMAASQARFLGLTARKTNVEYEGQQVNQQRTTLSNQSANYYNQLLGMTVPTPPSTSDYTKTVYTFTDGSLSCSITSLIAQPNGEYLVSYISSWTNDFTPVAAGSAIVNTDGTNYFVGSNQLRNMGTQLTFTGVSNGITYNDITINKVGNTYQYESNGVPIVLDNGTSATLNNTYNDEYLASLTPEQIYELQQEEAQYITMLNNKYCGGDQTQQWYVRYVENTTTGTWSPVFYKQDDVDNAIYSSDGNSLSNINSYTIGSAKETEEIKGVTSRLEKDSTGRYINITLNSNDPTKAVTYSLTTNTITDDDAYNDAMNQYEYDKYQYDQSIQEINAKIEIIQAQDKNLELRLKQLDTEQEAIQTEMDAVEKVIQKNTESTFKTFG